MLLGVRLLNNVTTVNSFDYVPTINFTEGDGPTIYFQLVDLNKEKASDGFPWPGRRYMPASGATLAVTVTNLNNANVVNRFATQPYPGDPSIWQLQMMAADTVRGTCSLTLVLTEGSVVTRGFANAALNVTPQANF